MIPYVIAFDLDGTIADTHTSWLEWYNEAYDDDLKLGDIVTWGIHKYAKHGNAIYEFFDVPGSYLRPKPFPDAAEYLKSLCDQPDKYRVIIATAISGHTKMATEKWRWVAQNLPWFDKDFLVLCEDKSVIRADMLVDDGVHNLDVFCGEKIIFDRPWNRDPKRSYFRAHSWSGLAYLIGLLAEHRR